MQFSEKEFNKYREEHPSERFWQALRNYCKVNYIWYQEKGGFEENKTELLVDTFYIKDERD